MVKTAGCLDHWHHASAKGAQCITAPQAVHNPAEVRPGMIFIMDHGGGLGHTGLVEKVNGGLLTTIEGNTDASGGREGGRGLSAHQKNSGDQRRVHRLFGLISIWGCYA